MVGVSHDHERELLAKLLELSVPMSRYALVVENVAGVSRVSRLQTRAVLNNGRSALQFFLELIGRQTGRGRRGHIPLTVKDLDGQPFESLNFALAR